MPRAHTPPILIERRQEMVARLTLRGLSLTNILQSITEAGIINPITNRPFSRSIIRNDQVALRKKWSESADNDTKKFYAQQLAVLFEVQRQAFNRRVVVGGNLTVVEDLDLVLRSHDRIAKLTGIAAADKMEITANVAPYTEEAAQELLERFRSEPDESTLDITPHTDRLSLGLTMSEEPTNGKENGSGCNGNS